MADRMYNNASPVLRNSGFGGLNQFQNGMMQNEQTRSNSALGISVSQNLKAQGFNLTNQNMNAKDT